LTKGKKGGTCESDWEVPSSREFTIHYLEEYERIENPKLIFGKYILIACVTDTRYSPEGDFDPDNPTGYATGQIIDIVIIDSVACYDGDYEGGCAGDTIEGIYSYGGDTGIIGKPQAGDLVGWRLGNYASIW
jgi:hypothetical protein